MLIEPTPQELHRDRNTPAQVLVWVDSPERVFKPEHDEEMFEEAALLALGEALDAGWAAVRYVNVQELICPGAQRERIRYQYAYRFDTVKKADPASQ